MKIYTKFIATLAVIAIAVFVMFCLDLGIRFKHEAESSKQLIKKLTPGTVEYERYRRWNLDSDIYYEHANKASQYEKDGKYDLAIAEYKKSLESKYGNWIAHRHLLDIYEKAGYHDLAIKEIDWLLSQKPSQQVVAELSGRKKKLEDSLKDSPRRISVIDSVTEKNYVLKEMGKPDEVLNLKDGTEAWIYKDYMDISKSMPNMSKMQPFVVIFNSDSIVVENYITTPGSIEVLRKESVQQEEGLRRR